MSTNYSGIAANVTARTNPASTIPSDGDNRNAASVDTAFKSLTDQAAFMQANAVLMGATNNGSFTISATSASAACVTVNGYGGSGFGGTGAIIQGGGSSNSSGGLGLQVSGGSSVVSGLGANAINATGGSNTGSAGTGGVGVSAAGGAGNGTNGNGGNGVNGIGGLASGSGTPGAGVSGSSSNNGVGVQASGSNTRTASRGALNLVAQSAMTAGTGAACQPGDLAWNGTNFMYCKSAGTWVVGW